MEHKIRLSIRAFHQRGHLPPIGIEARPSPAYIRNSYLRYLAFQWLDTAGLGHLKVDRLREVLRAAIAFALLGRMGVDLSVRVDEAQNIVATLMEGETDHAACSS